MSGVRVIACFRAKPGHLERVVEEWTAHAARCRAEPGCVQYELYRSSDDDHELTLLEQWADQAAYDVHWALERTRQLPAEGLTEAERFELYAHRLFTFDGAGEWIPLAEEER